MKDGIPKEAKPRHLVLATIDESLRPLSLRVLGAYAQAKGVKTTLLVVIKDLARIGHPITFSDSEIRQVAAFLEREGVTHLGFYLMTASLKPYALMVKALRARGFKGVIMAGGVHATLCPEESLVEGADFAVQGWGELPLEMILAGKDPSTIPGLVWRKGSAVQINKTAPEQKKDLNALPFPIFRFGEDRVLVKGRLRRLTPRLNRLYADWHGKYYDLVTSRGCVYQCAYCCNVNGAPVHRASVDHVIGELKHLREAAPGIAGINIQDDSFYAGSEEWIAEFSARMKAEVGLPFITRMIPRYVTAERLEVLKAGGLQYVTMGLEASDRMNKTLFNRHETAASFVKAARLVLEAGLYLSVDILIDNPYEKEDDLREMACTLNSLPRPNWGIVSLSLTPFPNTPLFARCVKDHMLERFATDAYDAMLHPSREGGYRTPRFWLLLNTVVLPRLSETMGARLIEMGPRNAAAVQMVERLARWMSTTRRLTTWLRDRTPWLYGGVYFVLRLFAGKHHQPKAIRLG